MGGAKRIHLIRTWGGNEKRRAMRVEQGNFSWGSEVATHKTRILDVVYNASDNDLVRTKTLVKNAIVLVDATHSNCTTSNITVLTRTTSTRASPSPYLMTRRGPERLSAMSMLIANTEN